MKQPRYTTVREAFGLDAPHQARIRTHSAGDALAEKPDEGFVFEKELVKIAQFWLEGNPPRGLLLTGPTGTGKTAFIREVAARTHWPIVVVGCHGELEFADLVGHLTLEKDGGTAWVDGPLVRAMKAGAVLLLDEVNFLRPSTVGGINGVLDAGRFEIPQTGEIVTVHPDFRLAATANSISGDEASSYRGTQRQNLAFLDRFIGREVDYLPEEEEVKALTRRVPSVGKNVAQVMVSFANGVRQMTREGRVAETISFRALHAWAQMVAMHSEMPQEQARVLLKTLQAAVLYRCPGDSKATIEGALREVCQRVFPGAI